MKKYRVTYPDANNQSDKKVDGNKIKRLLKEVPVENANLEAEKDETVVTSLQDNLPEFYTIGGKKHSKGGTPLNLPVGSFVFSNAKEMQVDDKDLLKEFGVDKKKATIAELSKNVDLNMYRQILADKTSTKLEKETALTMIAKGLQKLGKLSLVQESMKGFSDGIPEIGKQYLASVGIDPTTIVPDEPQKEEEKEEQHPEIPLDEDNMTDSQQQVAKYGKQVLEKFKIKGQNGELPAPDWYKGNMFSAEEDLGESSVNQKYWTKAQNFDLYKKYTGEDGKVFWEAYDNVYQIMASFAKHAKEANINFTFDDHVVASIAQTKVMALEQKSKIYDNVKKRLEEVANGTDPNIDVNEKARAKKDLETITELEKAGRTEDLQNFYAEAVVDQKVAGIIAAQTQGNETNFNAPASFTEKSQPEYLTDQYYKLCLEGFESNSVGRILSDASKTVEVYKKKQNSKEYSEDKAIPDENVYNPYLHHIQFNYQSQALANDDDKLKGFKFKLRSNANANIETQRGLTYDSQEEGLTFSDGYNGVQTMSMDIAPDINFNVADQEKTGTTADDIKKAESPNYVSFDDNEFNVWDINTANRAAKDMARERLLTSSLQLESPEYVQGTFMKENYSPFLGVYQDTVNVASTLGDSNQRAAMLSKARQDLLSGMIGENKRVQEWNIPESNRIVQLNVAARNLADQRNADTISKWDTDNATAIQGYDENMKTLREDLTNATNNAIMGRAERINMNRASGKNFYIDNQGRAYFAEGSDLSTKPPSQELLTTLAKNAAELTESAGISKDDESYPQIYKTFFDAGLKQHGIDIKQEDTDENTNLRLLKTIAGLQNNSRSTKKE